MALTNAQYDELMRSYDNQIALDYEIRNAHIQEVEGKIPRILEIRKEIADVGYQAAMDKLSGSYSEANAQALSHKLKALDQERTKLLVQAGYPADYMDLQYKCPDCKDTGFIGNQRCHCFKQATINIVYQQSHITESIKKDSFDNFFLDYYSAEIDPAINKSPLQSAEQALKTMTELAKDYKNNKKNIYLYGPTGTGKTLLANCLTRALLDQGISVIYLTAFNLFDIASKKTFDHDLDANEDYDALFDCEVLIIDDLGSEQTNKFHRSLVFQLVNERIVRNRSTIITSNLSIGDIKDLYGERVFSRITSNYALIKLFGDDIRLTKTLNKHQSHTF